MFVRLTVLLALLAPLFVLSACDKPGRARGITVVLETPPGSLDDRVSLDAIGQRIAQLITPGLVTFNDRSEPVPDLAETIRQVDPLTFEFVLRENLRFHNGSPLTSADVKATLDALRLNEVSSPRAQKLGIIRDIEAVDARTVRMHLKERYGPFLAELTFGIVPAERAKDTALQSASPTGAGPFRFVARPDEEHIELAPFDHYYGGKPEISALHFRVVRDETTRVLELLKGRADLVVNAISPAVLPLLKKEPHLRVMTKRGTGYAYMGFNVRSGPLADVRVRRAICHLLQREPIVEHKFHGLAVTANGMLPEAHWAYAPTSGCRYDPELAGRLLDEAGFPDPDGPGGKPRLALSYKTSTDRFRKSIALVFKEQLQQGGIAVDLRSLESGTLFGDIRKGNFELMTLKWSAVIEPDLMRWVFGSPFVPTKANNYGGLNRGGYQDPEVDRLLDAASVASHGERAALYAKALELLDRDLPYAPLWHESSVAVVSTRLEGYEPSAHGFFRPLADAREVQKTPEGR